MFNKDSNNIQVHKFDDARCKQKVTNWQKDCFGSSITGKAGRMFEALWNHFILFFCLKHTGKCEYSFVATFLLNRADPKTLIKSYRKWEALLICNLWDKPCFFLSKIITLTNTIKKYFNLNIEISTPYFPISSMLCVLLNEYDEFHYYLDFIRQSLYILPLRCSYIDFVRI